VAQGPEIETTISREERYGLASFHVSHEVVTFTHTEASSKPKYRKDVRFKTTQELKYKLKDIRKARCFTLVKNKILAILRPGLLSRNTAVLSRSSFLDYKSSCFF
jgi:hypothetical protein